MSEVPVTEATFMSASKITSGDTPRCKGFEGSAHPSITKYSGASKINNDLYDEIAWEAGIFLPNLAFFWYSRYLLGFHCLRLLGSFQIIVHPTC